MRSNASRVPLFWSVSLSIFVALVLMILPMPQWLFYFWPDWIALVLIYWALTEANRFGPWMAFVVGIMLEVLFIRTFGVVTLALVMLVFTVNRIHLQLKIMSIWQQTILITALVAISKLITGWLSGMITGFTITLEYWYSSLGNFLAWPFLYIILSELKINSARSLR